MTKNTEKNSETNPTIDNVLPEWRQRKDPIYDWEEGAWDATPDLKKRGIMAQMPGGMPCPWCAAKMQKTERPSGTAVCVKNPKHKVVWVPWGG